MLKEISIGRRSPSHTSSDVRSCSGASVMSEPSLEPFYDGEDWEAFETTRPERFAPLGAADADKDGPSCKPPDLENPVEMKKMKEEHEELTMALMALTTHFAQVQFRVQQIVDAPGEEKESLLKDLEDFAFRGLPSALTERLGDFKEDEIKEKMEIQKEKQNELIRQLKRQLEELESYAYETGDAGLPQSVILERHQLVVDQLKERLNLNVDELEKLSNEDLKLEVEQAIDELVSPLKMKDELVSQLKTQISDLERFIKYLHGEGTWDGGCTCACPKHGSPTKHQGHHEEELRAKTIQMMKKALTLVQMFAVAQFGCSSSSQFRMNTLKKSHKGNHWGDLRAKLEVAINRVYKLALDVGTPADGEYTSDSEDVPSVACNQALTAAVRKDLTNAIANLFQHGLIHVGQSQSLVPFVSCFQNRVGSRKSEISAWDLILKYYHVKNGDMYNSTPARKLSQSFNLDIVGSTAITNKQLLLSTIDNIITSHSRYKRSPDSHFKAFVCSGLNERKLVVWMRLIVRCQGLIEYLYEPWSYVVKTGFEDAFRSLDKLSSIHFDLPEDLAIRQFQNIKDAFQ